MELINPRVENNQIKYNKKRQLDTLTENYQFMILEKKIIEQNKVGVGKKKVEQLSYSSVPLCLCSIANSLPEGNGASVYIHKSSTRDR